MTTYRKPIIIWLDEYIGQFGHYQALKEKFASTLDPTRYHSLRTLSSDEINISKLIECDVLSDSSKSSAIEMRVYCNEEDCFQYIQEHKDNRIFLIVSDSMGKRFVPRILFNWMGSRQWTVDNQHGSLYVFSSDFLATTRWAIDYVDYVQIFDHEIILLARLTRDVADYFVRLGEETFDYKTYKFVLQSLKYFNWAKTLFKRANEVEKTATFNKREQNVDRQIAVAQALLKQLSNNDDDIDRCIVHTKSVDESDVELGGFHQQIYLNAPSSCLQAEPTDIESTHFLPESTSAMSLADIKEKMPSQIKEFVDDQQRSSEILVYLQQPSTPTDNFKSFSSILKQLFETNLIVSLGGQDNYKLLKSVDLSVIVLPLSTNDDKQVLEQICSLGNFLALYLLGAEPDTPKARQDFFTRYPQVCALLNDPEELAVKVALDVALRSRIKADRYARNEDKDHANKMYDQCIVLLNRLNVLVWKSRDNKD